LLCFAAALLLSIGPALSPAAAAAPAAESIADRVDVPAGMDLLIVHYNRPDGDYRGWNVWSWEPDADGRAFGLGGRTDFGRYALIPVSPDADRRGLIIRKNEWEARDVAQDRFVSFADGERVQEVWLVAGDDRVYTDPSEIDLSVRLIAAFLDAEDTALATFSRPVDDATLRSLELLVDGREGRYRIVRTRQVDLPVTRGVAYAVRFTPDVRFEDVSNLSLAGDGIDTRTLYARDVLDGERFVAPDAELGSWWSEGSTIFRVWSPVSESVDVLLYDDHDAAAPNATLPMSHVGNGVWEAEVAGDLHGVGYRYRYFSYGRERIAADIHCFAATVDSDMSVVVDLDRLDPDGWGETPQPTLERLTDEIVYEVHVRDFTVADPSVEPEKRGTYLGLIHDGAIDVGGETVSTGLAHLKELGVTAVHLLPIQDYGGGVEEYNWGYWTSLFNVAEANYATDPYEWSLPIVELKQAIQGLHENDVRVILDVVYNHTSSSYEWSPFYQSVPYYWFRTTPDGVLRNDAGVGNSMADERTMVRKYIGDSLAYWVEEYRVDGFRFDLLGTHRPESVEQWIIRLRSLRPDLTIYGEPWTGGGPVYFPKGAQRGMGLAVFNDHFRNALRGDLDGDGTGYATGPGGDVPVVLRGVMGAIDDFADDPTETINYVSAHDNLTLWDKLLRVQGDAPEAVRRDMQKLAHGVVLTSQGLAFIHAGAEFARTKGGNHNSYNAGDEVNKLDWPRKVEYADVYEYVRGLVHLRRAHPAFRMDERDEVRRNVRPLPTASASEHVIAFEIDGGAVGDGWSRIVVVYNGTPDAHAVRLPSGAWTQVVDGERAGVEGLRRVRGEIELDPWSMAVLHR